MFFSPSNEPEDNPSVEIVIGESDSTPLKPYRMHYVISLGIAGQLLSWSIFGMNALVGSIVGFVLYETASASETGQPNRLERILGLRDRSLSLRWHFFGYIHIHLHHWLNMLLLLILLLCLNLMKPFIIPQQLLKTLYGVCIGGTFQGLKYKDWSRVIWIEIADSVNPMR